MWNLSAVTYILLGLKFSEFVIVKNDRNLFMVVLPRESIEDDRLYFTCSQKPKHSKGIFDIKKLLNETLHRVLSFCLGWGRKNSLLSFYLECFLKHCCFITKNMHKVHQYFVLTNKLSFRKKRSIWLFYETPCCKIAYLHFDSLCKTIIYLLSPLPIAIYNNDHQINCNSLNYKFFRLYDLLFFRNFYYSKP